jgi:hypothetical protein
MSSKNKLEREHSKEALARLDSPRTEVDGLPVSADQQKGALAIIKRIFF